MISSKSVTFIFILPTLYFENLLKTISNLILTDTIAMICIIDHHMSLPYFGQNEKLYLHVHSGPEN